MGPKGRIRGTYSSTAIRVRVHLSFIRPEPRWAVWLQTLRPLHCSRSELWYRRSISC